jgi:hypothetical protein
MNSAIERRLVAAEQRLMPTQATPQVIIVRRGLHAGDLTFATAGSLRWKRAPGESFAGLKARAVDEAAAAGERFVVIRGLCGSSAPQ